MTAPQTRDLIEGAYTIARLIKAKFKALWREFVASLSAPATCQHHTRLLEILEVIHLMHCCEPFDSRIHRADSYTDDCCTLCKKLRAGIAQACRRARKDGR